MRGQQPSSFLSRLLQIIWSKPAVESAVRGSQTTLLELGWSVLLSELTARQIDVVERRVEQIQVKKVRTKSGRKLYIIGNAGLLVFRTLFKQGAGLLFFHTIPP